MLRTIIQKIMGIKDCLSEMYNKSFLYWEKGGIFVGDFMGPVILKKG